MAVTIGVGGVAHKVNIVIVQTSVSTTMDAMTGYVRILVFTILAGAAIQLLVARSNAIHRVETLLWNN